MFVFMVPICGIICGTIIAITAIKTKAARYGGSNINEAKLLDNMHVLEMRVQDLEQDLRMANEKINLLESKNYKEIDK